MPKGDYSAEHGRQTRERVIVFIGEFVAEHGYSPSIVEICGGAGVRSRATVARALNHLRDDGRVTWQPKVPRTVRLTDPGTSRNGGA